MLVNFLILYFRKLNRKCYKNVKRVEEIEDFDLFSVFVGCAYLYDYLEIMHSLF